MYTQLVEDHWNRLKKNQYPGRGIVTGVTPDGKHLIQVYWIMGRSENSRNRIFDVDGEFVRTKAYDESKVIDPSLIIYYPSKVDQNRHIISNGDQTDTIYDFLRDGKTFEDALNTRTFEPDAPNYTPRISGIVDLEASYAYQLSILKSTHGNGDACIRAFYTYETAIWGYGHCIHTYQEDGNPLPSFSGEPYLMPVFNDMDEMIEKYWDALNSENRISIMAKYIDRESGCFHTKIINRF